MDVICKKISSKNQYTFSTTYKHYHLTEENDELLICLKTLLDDRNKDILRNVEIPAPLNKNLNTARKISDGRKYQEQKSDFFNTKDCFKNSLKSCDLPGYLLELF